MPKKFKLALLGGTFNPIHIGHLFIAEEVRVSLGYDKIVFVPAFKPAHKDIADDDQPELRLAMVRAAVAGNPHFMVEDSEIRRNRTSYTIETVQELLRKYPAAGRIGLILGDDLVKGFNSWKGVEELLATVRVIVASRRSAQKTPFPVECDYLNNVVVNVSSSDIRGRIAAGQAWRYLVPEAVHDIIREHGLYV
jgi:nicotinate-nucleotide adenylyltransferase